MQSTQFSNTAPFVNGLGDLRREIDDVDDRILALLDERARLASRVGRAKQAAQAPVYDPEREQRVIERLAHRSTGRFPRESIRAVYLEVMSACRAVQAPSAVSFLGPEGTFSHAASRALFGGGVRGCPAPTIAGVFDAVANGHAEYGVVPVENSSEGSVNDAVEALVLGRVLIRREMLLEVSQCLLSVAPDVSSIARVYSHPQALAQCQHWLARNLGAAELVATASTAAAVQKALLDPSGAAVASRLAAETYGVSVLCERIHDDPDNATRFVVLAREDAPPSGVDKTTMAFSLRGGEGPSALRPVLDVLAQEGVHLLRIESRPSGQKAWDYVFIVDLEGHRADPNVARAVERMREHCVMVRHLGSYPRCTLERSVRAVH